MRRRCRWPTSAPTWSAPIWWAAETPATRLMEPSSDVVAEVSERAAEQGGRVVAHRLESLESQDVSALLAHTLEAFGGLDWCCVLNGATGAGAGDGLLLT